MMVNHWWLAFMDSEDQKLLENHNALYSGFSHVLANWHSIMEKTMGDINSKAIINGFSNVLLMDNHHTCLNWGLVLESIGEKKLH